MKSEILFSENVMKFTSLVILSGVLIFLVAGIMLLCGVSFAGWLEYTLGFISATAVVLGCLWYAISGVINYRHEIKTLDRWSENRKTKKIEGWFYCYTFFLVIAIVLIAALAPNFHSIDPTDQKIAYISGKTMMVLMGGWAFIFLRWIVRMLALEIRQRFA